MNEVQCWIFSVILTLAFLAMGIIAQVQAREERHPVVIWGVVLALYGMVMFQMYLIYRYPPPGEIPTIPCWLEALKHLVA